MNRGGPILLLLSAPRIKLALAARKHVTMPTKALLYEVDQLKGVSDRLDLLADQHPIMGDEIVSISGSIRRTAALLEVLMAIRIKPA
jgi:hypothetical protein